MRLERELVQLIRIVKELKRRRIFVSMVMTNTKAQLSWWDAGAHEVKTGDIYSAQHHLNLLNENDQQEMAFVERRLGRVY